MGARAIVTVGSAASFVVAAVAGVLGNQLTEDAVWAWVAFGMVLVVGAGVTALVAHRSTPGLDQIAGDGREQRTGRGHTSSNAAVHEPEPHTVEGPVAREGNVTLRGKYVAGHDMTITGTDGARDKKRS